MQEVLNAKNAPAASEPQGQTEHKAPDIEKMRADMPSEEVLSDLADLYKMFGDSTRLSILSSLRYHEYCVTHLAELLNMTTSAISHQLRILRASNLVRYRREGKQSFYSLADEHVEQIIDMGLEHILEE